MKFHEILTKTEWDIENLHKTPFYMSEHQIEKHIDKKNKGTRWSFIKFW